METFSHEASLKREVVMIERLSPAALASEDWRYALEDILDARMWVLPMELTFPLSLSKPSMMVSKWSHLELSDNYRWAAQMPQCSYVLDIIKHNHFTQESAAQEPAAQAGKSEIIFDGPKSWRMLNGGVMMRPRLKGLAVNIRPPKWTDNTFWIRAERSQRPAASSDGAAVESEIAYDANVGGSAEEDSEEDNEVDRVAGFCLEDMIPTNYRPRYNHSPPFVRDESLEEITAESSPYFEKDLTTKKRNTATVSDDDDLLTKIAPLIKQQIEDALSSTLLPLISVLRSREEEEQKHREQMLALEKRKLALKRDKLLFELRRGAKRPRSSHKSARHQGHKKPRY